MHKRKTAPKEAKTPELIPAPVSTLDRPSPKRKVLALRMVDLANDEPIEKFCKRFKISPAEYNRMVSDPMFFEDIWDAAFSHIMIKAIPEIMMRWRDKCISGDIKALKMLFTMKGKIEPEQHAHLHLHREVAQLEGEALDAKIDEMRFRLESLKKESA